MQRPQTARWTLLLPLVAAAAAVAAAGPRAQGLLHNTALVAAGTLCLALPLGAILAVLVCKIRMPGGRLAGVVLLTMLFMPLPLTTAAWHAGFGSLGWFTDANATAGAASPLLSGMPGVVWVHAAAAVPWVALIVGAALCGVDRRLEEAALLDASAAQVLLRVSLRSASPAFLVAAGWLSVTVAQEMAVTNLFQVRTFAEEVYTLSALGSFDPLTGDAASKQDLLQRFVLGVLAIALVGVAVVWAAARFLAVANLRQGDLWRWAPKRRGVAAALLWGLLLLLAGAPVGNLLAKAGIDAHREGDSWRREWSAVKTAEQLAAAPVRYRRELWQSAKLGVGVATGAVLAGGAIAWRLRRAGAERLVWLTLIGLALAIPGPVLGLAAIRVFNQPPDSPLAWLAWPYDHTLLVTWCVQMVRATPITALLLWPVWQNVPQRVLDAARLEGTRGWWVAARSSQPALRAAWLVALAVSLADLSATLLVMPPGDMTLTMQLFNLLHSGVDDRVAAISLGMIAFFAMVAWGVSGLWERADPANTR